ncbi:MAG: hypothetical protein R3292_13940 [Alcanivorax sp.]|nr:hypothetical protein [Alcanivorax sp.]
MRLLGLLITLLAIGWLVAQQLKPAPQAPAISAGNDQPGTIKAPTRPEDVPQFREDMNALMKQQNEQQRATIEQATH